MTDFLDDSLLKIDDRYHDHNPYESLNHFEGWIDEIEFKEFPNEESKTEQEYDNSLEEPVVISLESEEEDESDLIDL